MRILLIRPIISPREDAQEEAIFRPFLSPGTEITARRLKYASSSIECEYDVAVNTPDILRVAAEGQAEGFDGAIINCFVDPGLEAVREAVTYPVVGAGSAAVQLALSVGKRIAILTIVPNILPLVRRLNADYMASGRVCAVRSIDVPVLSIYGDQLIYEKLYEQAVAAIQQNHADTIVFGCTGLGGMAEKVQQRLAENGMPVPVVDPAGASVSMLEALIRNRLTHSKLTWMAPPEKLRNLK